MQRKAAPIVEIVQTDPAVEKSSASPAGARINTGRMFVSLKPLANARSSDDVIDRLRPKLGAYSRRNLLPAIRRRTFASAAVEATRNSSYTLQGDDLQRAERLGRAHADKAQARFPNCAMSTATSKPRPGDHAR